MFKIKVVTPEKEFVKTIRKTAGRVVGQFYVGFRDNKRVDVIIKEMSNWGLNIKSEELCTSYEDWKETARIKSYTHIRLFNLLITLVSERLVDYNFFTNESEARIIEEQNLARGRAIAEADKEIQAALLQLQISTPEDGED